MKTQITKLVLSLVAVVAIATSANAQQTRLAVPAQQQSPVQQYVQPTFPQPPAQQNMYYFGVNVELRRDWNGTMLVVTSVTPGSPACRAGLEIGDAIRTVNGRGFAAARDSFEAVSMMNQFVSTSPIGGGGAPAAAASAGTAAQTFVSPGWPAPQPIARMVVRNVRNGQNVNVTVVPQRRGFFPAAGAAPAAAARR